MIQAFQPGRLYRITRGRWNNNHTLKFLRKNGNKLVFALPQGTEHISKNLVFEWQIRPQDILQARELTAEEEAKLR